MIFGPTSLYIYFAGSVLTKFYIKMGQFWKKNSFLDIANFKPTLEFYLKFHSNNFSEILRLLTLLVSTLDKERKLT